MLSAVVPTESGLLDLEMLLSKVLAEAFTLDSALVSDTLETDEFIMGADNVSGGLDAAAGSTIVLGIFIVFCFWVFAVFAVSCTCVRVFCAVVFCVSSVL